MILVDTSGLLALANRAEIHHGIARDYWVRHAPRRDLVTHSYIVSEASAIVQRRLGLKAVRNLLLETLLPVRVHWVDEALHTTAITALVAAESGSVSLVDQVSFALMRKLGIREAFAFDADFHRAGFDTVPT